MMNTFRISAQTALTLLDRFAMFQEDRAKVEARIESYRRDFFKQSRRISKGKFWKKLEDTYRELSEPDLSHLKRTGENEYLWELNDIAIVLGRNKSNISRVLAAMKLRHEWLERLEPLCEDRFYKEATISLILDFYEELYLQRILVPRKGRRLNTSEEAEIRRFWQYLHEHPAVTQDEMMELLGIKTEGDGNAPDPESFLDEFLDPGEPESLKDSAVAILKKLFNFRVGTVFALLYGLYYELELTFPPARYPVLIAALGVFLYALWQIRYHRYNGYNPASLAAGVVIFILLWGAGNTLSLWPGMKKESWPLKPDLSRREQVSPQAKVPDDRPAVPSVSFVWQPVVKDVQLSMNCGNELMFPTLQVRPDVSLAQSLRSLNSTPMTPFIPKELLSLWQHREERKRIRTMMEKGLELNFYECTTPGRTDLIVVNRGNEDILCTGFQVVFWQPGRNFYMEDKSVLFPVGLPVAFSDIFWKSDGNHFTSAAWKKPDPQSVIQSSVSWRELERKTVKAGTDLSRFGLMSEPVFFEDVGYGHHFVTMKITNRTGRKIQGLSAILQAVAENGTVISRALPFCNLPKKDLGLFYGDSIYVPFIFRNPEPLPKDCRYELKVQEIFTEPAMTL